MSGSETRMRPRVDAQKVRMSGPKTECPGERHAAMAEPWKKGAEPAHHPCTSMGGGTEM